MSKFHEQIRERNERNAVIKEFTKVDRPIGPAPPATENLRPGAPAPTTQNFLDKFKHPEALDKTGPWKK